jgi:hypothetical protein
VIKNKEELGLHSQVFEKILKLLELIQKGGSSEIKTKVVFTI